MNHQYLYRGVNQGLDALQPKKRGRFACPARYGEAWYGEWQYGETENNAVIRHQLHQEGFPTAGLSTTPVFQRAKYYATHGPGGVQNDVGDVYQIDRSRLCEYGIKEHVVFGIVQHPSIPEDHEVILVPPLGRSLPLDVIISIIKVRGGN